MIHNAIERVHVCVCVYCMRYSVIVAILLSKPTGYTYHFQFGIFFFPSFNETMKKKPHKFHQTIMMI